MTGEHKKILQDMSKSQYGKVLEIFLKEELDSIDDISSCKTLKEMEGRQFAIKLINKLFSFMQNRNTTEREKNQYE